jgi:uncharacterized repeat protein (TIGR01451 family)
MKMFKLILKICAGLSLLLAMVGQIFSAPQQSGADAPRFNFKTNDFELFRGYNSTAGEDEYKDPVSAVNDDTVIASVYYHNGVEGTVAENTKIKVTIPSTATGNQTVLSASISADNAETITDTIVDGQIVGQSGLTIGANGPKSEVSFIPGSLRWFPNQSDSPVSLPGGVNGDQIISDSGLNIGDIAGCWQYSGSVVFMLKVKVPAQVGSLVIDKKVKNLDSTVDFADSNSTKSGQKMIYRIDVDNNGEVALPDVLVKDTNPTEATFVPGSLKYYPNKGTVEAPIPGNQSQEYLFSQGLNFGELTVGDSIRLEYQVTVADSLNDNSNFTNSALATSGTINDDDSVVTTVTNAGIAEIVRSKSAYNITQSADATETLANPGDSIRYRLSVKNVGNATGDVKIEDGIADVLEYAEITDLGDGILSDDPTNPIEDNRRMIDFGSYEILPNNEVTCEFTVRVKDPLPKTPRSGNHYDLIMFNEFGNPVVVRITPPKETAASLSIDKLVRNVSTNSETFTKENSAYAGDTIEYQIVIVNSGDAPADGTKIIDTLPANLSYASGTTVVDRDGSKSTLTDGITVDGITFNQIPAGSTYILYLRAQIDNGVSAGSQFVNKATLTYSDQVLESTAKTVIAVPVVQSVATTLPKTGATPIIGSIFAGFFGLSNYLYLTGKKKLIDASLAAIN